MLLVPLLELLHHLEYKLAYKKRTEIIIEMMKQLEEEGQFPHADYAFDNSVRTLELTRLEDRMPALHKDLHPELWILSGQD